MQEGVTLLKSTEAAKAASAPEPAPDSNDPPPGEISKCMVNSHYTSVLYMRTNVVLRFDEWAYPRRLTPILGHCWCWVTHTHMTISTDETALGQSLNLWRIRNTQNTNNAYNLCSGFTALAHHLYGLGVARRVRPVGGAQRERCVV